MVLGVYSVIAMANAALGLQPCCVIPPNLPVDIFLEILMMKRSVIFDFTDNDVRPIGGYHGMHSRLCCMWRFRLPWLVHISSLIIACTLGWDKTM